MSEDLKARIFEALQAIDAPGGNGNLVSAGMIESVHVGKRGDAVFTILVNPAMGPAMETLRQNAEAAVKAIDGIASVTAVLTAERAQGAQQEEQQQPDDGPDPHGMNKNPPLQLPFKYVIAVGSGKGGVGKSTAAFNIAVALSRLGYRTALLDADIYGPSVPRLTATTGMKPVTDEGGKIVPIEAHGLSLMSMGYLVEEEKPMIWRGPMVQTAFYQMLRDVAWRRGGEDMDILIIDMPPGTGDVQLTLAQKVPVTGAVIVSTPQDLALIDARKAIAMFEKTDVPVLGIVENMSHYCCPSCGHIDHVFGHDGARTEAEKRGLCFLGGVPLNAEIRAASDAGIPLAPQFYETIAKTLESSL